MTIPTRCCLAGLLGLAAAFPAAAGELRTALGAWDYGVSGFIVQGGDRLDLERDLGAEAEGTRGAQLEYDGAGGWWPDWSLRYERIGGAGRREQSTPFSFGPILVTPGVADEVATAVDFDDAELALRYPFGSARLSGALGVSAKWLQGDVIITNSDSGDRVHQAYDEIFPELHGQARWQPWSWLAGVATVQGIRQGDNRALEWRAVLELRALPPMLIEVGWQEKSYAIAVRDYAMDARLAGAMLRFGLFLPAGAR